MMKTFAKSMMILGTFLCMGCASGRQQGASLAGKWNIESANGVAATNVERPAFISFGANGEVHGCSSVNNFFGSYVLDKKQLTLSNMGMTRMMGANMDVEMAVTEALGNVKGVKVKGNKAQLLDKDGKVVMELAKAAE